VIEKIEAIIFDYLSFNYMAPAWPSPGRIKIMPRGRFFGGVRNSNLLISRGLQDEKLGRSTAAGRGDFVEDPLPLYVIDSGRVLASYFS
jgi:hypothetical protein